MKDRQSSQSTQSGRTRNAAVTRETLLEAARVLFTHRNYEQVGVRDVAAAAGVDATLVIRYFGSKEGLFVEAVPDTFDASNLLKGKRVHLGQRLARYVLQKEKDSRSEFDPLIALLRSAGSEGAGKLLRDGLDRAVVEPLAEWLGGEQARQRAGLIVAYLMGLAVMRGVLGSCALVEGDEEQLVTLAAPVLQKYIDGKLT